KYDSARGDSARAVVFWSFSWRIVIQVALSERLSGATSRVSSIASRRSKYAQLERDVRADRMLRRVELLAGRLAEQLDDRDDEAGDEDQENDVLGRRGAVFVRVKRDQQILESFHDLPPWG